MYRNIRTQNKDSKIMYRNIRTQNKDWKIMYRNIRTQNKDSKTKHNASISISMQDKDRKQDKVNCY